VRFACVAGGEGFAAGDVLGGRYRFEMVGIAAGANAAAVVDVPARGNDFLVGEMRPWSVSTM
jgi:hypothetical protein